MLQKLLITKTRVGVAIKKGVIVQLFILQVLVGSHHHCQVSIARVEVGVRGAVSEVSSHPLQHFTKQSAGENRGLLVTRVRFYDHMQAE